MKHRYTARILSSLTGATLLFAPAAWSQSAPAAPAPATAPAKADSVKPPPPSPVSLIRNKISADDLLSAESGLEVHQAANGKDGPWLVGLSWLARGALLTGDRAKARRYAAETRAECARRIEQGADITKDHDLEYAFGTAVEVQAQLLAKEKGTAAAVAFLEAERRKITGPITLICRVNKRLDMLTLPGRPAPELAIEDWLGDKPPTLASLRGKPVLLFLWAYGCGDCRAQAATLGKVKARHAGSGLQVMAVTRYYDELPSREMEKARADSMWKANYTAVGTIPSVFSTASMERYGVSSTPTFVFIDREGVVRDYTPTRLNEEEFERRLAVIERPKAPARAAAGK